MDTGLAMGLIGFLVVLFLGYNILLQHKARELTLKKQEIAKQKSIIAITEEVIDFSRIIPFNQKLFLCMHVRILDSVKIILATDPKNNEFKGQNIGRSNIIEELKRQENMKESCSFRVPRNDKQAIGMLKIIKRIKDIVRSEHNKGRFPSHYYAEEMERLDFLQMKINIENAMQRSKEAIATGQYGTALQLLRKSIQTLSPRSDDYSINAKEKMESFVSKLEAKQQKKNEVERQAFEEKERDDMDEIFGEKKKW